MAHRCIPTQEGFPWGPEHKGQKVPSGGPRLPGKDIAEDYARCNHLYNAALPHMHRLRVTEGGNYALWLDDQDRPAVIWAFQDASAPCTGPARDLETGKALTADGTLDLQAGHVYLLGDRESQTT